MEITFTEIGRAYAKAKANVETAEAELNALHERHAAELTAATAEIHARQEDERKAADEKLATAKYWRADWREKFEAATDPQPKAVVSQEPEVTATAPATSNDGVTEDPFSIGLFAATDPPAEDETLERKLSPSKKTALFEGTVS